jgi:predicted ATPase
VRGTGNVAVTRLRSAPVEFRLLGVLEVESAGVMLTPARAKQRALLALLLLRVGEVVASDELIDGLWGERPPPTARKALHGHVSALRKRLGAERIVSDAGGYRFLLGDGDQLDVERFRCLLAEARGARPAVAAEKLAQALRLVRGEPLGEFRYQAFAAVMQLERRILNHDPQLAAPDALVTTPPSTTATDPDGIVTFLLFDKPADRTFLRPHIAQHGGAELDAGDPDSLLAVFARTRDAVVAAIGAQQLAGGALRVAVHSAEASTGNGFAGSGPGDVATLCSATHPGQIVISWTARDLLRETPLQDVDVDDLGRQRLRDLAQPWQLFQLIAPGSVREFPPPRSLDTYTTNLPPQAAPLIGRQRELAEIVGLLGSADVQLVTLTGAGGIGKTRLAVQAAGRLLDAFPDGVFFVDLSALADAEHVLVAAAAVLGIREVAGRSVSDELRRQLSRRRLLLVLDNFEHLPAAAPTLADVLGPSSRAAVLVTSRTPLRVAGEHVCPVPPLERPPSGRRAVAAERIARFDAVALFAARARAVRHDFAVTAEKAGAVARICRSLDGLPLAIELAAARVAVLPPAAMQRRLDQRLQLLKRTAGGAPDRHRTLRATIEWSYDLLQPEHQQLFWRLASFAGGTSLEAAEAVCGDGLDVVDGLVALVDASLLRQDGGEQPRFAFLETTREYAIERLVASGEDEAVRRRHAAHYLALAEEAEGHLRERPGEWLERLECEHDNLRAALDHLEAAGETQLLLRVAGALWRFWYLKAQLREGRRRLEAALALDRSATTARAKALIGLTVLTGNDGDLLAATHVAREARALNRTLGDDWGEAYATHMLGAAMLDQTELSEAEPLLEQSAAAFRRLGDEHSALLATRNLARLLDRRGERGRAGALHQENLRLARESDNPRIEASSLGALATIAADEGRLGDAQTLLRRSLRIHRELGDLLDSAVDLCRCAFVFARDGRAEAAVAVLSSFDNVRDEIGTRASWVAAMNEETLTIARRQLDEASFAAALARGQALSLDDTLALAVAALPERTS